MDYDKRIAGLEKKIKDQQKEIELFRRAFAELGVILADAQRASAKGRDGEKV